jgi:hypothetical protein
MRAERAPSGAGRSTGTISRIGTISAPRSVDNSSRSFSVASRNISRTSRLSAFSSSETRVKGHHLGKLSAFNPAASSVVNEGPVKGFNIKNTVEFGIPKIKKPDLKYTPHRVRPRRSTRLHSTEVHKPNRNIQSFHKKINEIPQINKPKEILPVKSIPSRKEYNRPLNILTRKENAKAEVEKKINRAMAPAFLTGIKQVNYETVASKIVPEIKINVIPKQSTVATRTREISKNMIAIKKHNAGTVLKRVTEVKNVVKDKILEIHKSITRPEVRVELDTAQKTESNLNTKNELVTRPAVKTNEIVVFQFNPTKKPNKTQEKSNNDDSKKFEADSNANHARLNAILNAWKMAFSDIRSYGSKPSGRDIVKYLPSKPDNSLISELALEQGKKSDGSYDEVRSTLSLQGKIERISSLAGKIVEMLPAVRKRKIVAKPVTKKDVQRVLSELSPGSEILS